jgi:signal peptidase I
VSVHVLFVVVRALATYLGAGGFVWLVLAAVTLDAVGLRMATMVDAIRIVGRHPGPRAPVLHVIVAGVLIYAFAVALTLGERRLVVEAFKTPSGSMIPTLLVGDHLFVDKQRRPHRGDVIVFPFPEHPEQDFVKRIVGMPGDTLLFRNGHPFINDVEVPHCVVGPYSYAEDDSPVPLHSGTLEIEVLEGHPHFAFYDAASGAFSETQGPFVVKSGEIFVLGDNRNNSHDSRMWFGGLGGGVPQATVIGVAAVVWLSVNDRGIEWSRTGQAVDAMRLPAAMSSLEPALQRCLAQTGGR